MKKNLVLIALCSLVMSGCGGNKVSSTSKVNSSNDNGVSSSVVASSSNNEVSSTVSSSVTTSSSSTSSSSSTEADEYAFGFGEESVAASNPGNWYYWNAHAEWNLGGAVDVTKARCEDGRVEFAYANREGNCPFGAQLFYHQSDVNVGDSVSVSLQIKSPMAGKIRINGEVVTLRDGTTTYEGSRVLGANQSALAITFGTDEEGLLLTEGTFVISNVVISKQTNLLSIVKHAVSAQNYTISYENGVKTGTFTFNEKYAHYHTDEYYAGGSIVEDFGFMENETGVFGFKIAKDVLVTDNRYLTDEEGNNVKGLYTTNDVLSTGYYTFTGLPSAYVFDNELLNVPAQVGVEVEYTTREDKRTVKNILAVAGFDWLVSDYNIDSTGIKFGIDADENFYMRVTRQYGDDLKYTLTNIGTTSYSKIDNYVSLDSYGPGVGEAPLNAEVSSMLERINSSNYTFMYNAANCLFSMVVTSKYVYRETTFNGETTINGAIYLGGELREFDVDDNGNLNVKDSIYSSLSEFSLVSFNCFKMAKAADYEKGAEGYKISLETYDSSMLTNLLHAEVAINEVELLDLGELISVSFIAAANAENELAEDVVNYGQIGLFGESSNELMDTYIAAQEGGAY